jgi:hypothetical protein
MADARWFVGGELNVTVNWCVRACARGRRLSRLPVQRRATRFNVPLARNKRLCVSPRAAQP